MKNKAYHVGVLSDLSEKDSWRECTRLKMPNILNDNRKMIKEEYGIKIKSYGNGNMPYYPDLEVLNEMTPQQIKKSHMANPAGFLCYYQFLACQRGHSKFDFACESTSDNGFMSLRQVKQNMFQFIKEDMLVLYDCYSTERLLTEHPEFFDRKSPLFDLTCFTTKKGLNAFEYASTKIHPTLVSILKNKNEYRDNKVIEYLFNHS